jgi:hypothetical protein
VCVCVCVCVCVRVCEIDPSQFSQRTTQRTLVAVLRGIPAEWHAFVARRVVTGWTPCRPLNDRCRRYQCNDLNGMRVRESVCVLTTIHIARTVVSGPKPTLIEGRAPPTTPHPHQQGVSLSHAILKFSGSKL